MSPSAGWRVSESCQSFSVCCTCVNLGFLGATATPFVHKFTRRRRRRKSELMLGESAACCLDMQRRLLSVPGLVLLSKSGFRSLRALFSLDIHNDMEPNKEITLLENKNMLLWLVREFSAETRENVISTGATALYRIQDTVRTRRARVLF